MTMVNQEKLPFFRLTWAKFYSFVHHVLLAVTLASATVALEQTRWFEPFDLATRVFMTYFQAWDDEKTRKDIQDKGFRPEWNPAAAKDRPLVIIVPQLPAQAKSVRLYPATFAALLIQAAAAQEPRVLAINLDSLDPNWDDLRLNDPQCDYLRAVDVKAPSSAVVPGFEIPSVTPGGCGSLPGDTAPPAESIRMAMQARSAVSQALAEATKKTTVVVKTSPLPLIANEFQAILKDGHPFDQRVLARRLEWTFDLCQIPKLHVAYDVPPRDSGRGDGVMFDRGIPTLGNVVYEVSRRARPQRQSDVQLIQNAIEPALDACTLFRDPFAVQLIGSPPSSRNLREETIALMEKVAIMTLPPDFGGIGTINSQYHETLAHIARVDVGSLRPGEPVGRIIPPGLKDRVVFLGDDYLRANLLTYKDIPEVAFNAAVYYSNVHGAIGVKHVVAFWLDVLLGALLGALFAWTWRAYGRARQAMDQLPARSLGEIFVKAPAYFRSLGILVLNLILLAALTWAMFGIANFFLRKGVWINPLPLVLGISIKALLASRQIGAEHHAEDRWTFYNQHPDVLLQIPIILISIGMVLYLGH